MQVQILNHRQIQQKIKRLAIEILEHNHAEQDLILAGINNNGVGFAQMLLTELLHLTDQAITLTRIRLNPADPMSGEIHIEMPPEQLKDKVVIIVDDVANTGRTIFYACKPIMDTLPKKVEVAVLVDRTHKAFPIKVDYFGLSLATTLMENIDVKIREVEEYAVFLN
ncbi:MAG: phosphoribosyltransferase family protein [Bacteroidota bacterium]